MSVVSSIPIPQCSLRKILRGAAAGFVIQTRSELRFSVAISGTAQHSQQFTIGLDRLRDGAGASTGRRGRSERTRDANDPQREAAPTHTNPHNRTLSNTLASEQSMVKGKVDRRSIWQSLPVDPQHQRAMEAREHRWQRY